MQLRSKITVARNIRIHHHSLFNAKHKMQLFFGLEVADGTVKTTFKQQEKRFKSVYMASDFYLSIWTCWNTELQRVQVNQCQFCVLKPKKIFALPSAFLVVCTCSFSTCLDCFMIFAPNRHECVTVVIKCLCPISLCFILSCLDILKWKGFLIKPTVFSQQVYELIAWLRSANHNGRNPIYLVQFLINISY